MHIVNQKNGLRFLYASNGYRLIIDGETLEENDYIIMADGKEMKDYNEIKIGEEDNNQKETDENINIEDKSLDEIKQNQIILSKENLQKYLNNNPLFSKAHDPNGEYYNVDEDHQNRLNANLSTYELAVKMGVTPILTWNATGKSCEVWTIEQLAKLALEMKSYVAPLISMQQHMEEDIQNAFTKEDVLKINVKFNDESINDYKPKYYKMIGVDYNE